MKTKIKTDIEIDAMRESGRMLGTVLEYLRPKAVAGISTKELADIAAKELKQLGGKPSFLNYQGFPDVICISINAEIVHGIPSRKRILRSGDIVGLDFGVTYRGMITDGAISVIIDKPRNEASQKLIEVTNESLLAGIARVKGGVRVGEISNAIESSILRRGSFGIPKDLVGHGVGHQLWEEPNIPNYGNPNDGPILSSGMTIAIEPMVTLGSDQIVVLDDGWTIETADSSLAAHFEHTVLIVDKGCEILTTS